MNFRMLCLNLYALNFKIIPMEKNIALNKLQKRNNSLKSQLIHDQLKVGSYHFGYFKKFLLVINEYKKSHSFFKVSSAVDISHQEMVNWYIRGQQGDPKFRSFYLAINAVNNLNDVDSDEEIVLEDDADEGIIEEKDYIIAQYGDGWSYKTHIDGEKVFIISNELKTLKEKVKAKHLPLD